MRLDKMSILELTCTRSRWTAARWPSTDATHIRLAFISSLMFAMSYWIFLSISEYFKDKAFGFFGHQMPRCGFWFSLFQPAIRRNGGTRYCALGPDLLLSLSCVGRVSTCDHTIIDCSVGQFRNLYSLRHLKVRKMDHSADIDLGHIDLDMLRQILR